MSAEVYQPLYEVSTMPSAAKRAPKPDDELTRTYPDGALDVCQALDEARTLAILALGHPDRTASLWYTNEALDLLQRIVP